MRALHSPAVRPEILAPAGDAEALRVAVFAGADAVYLGLRHFNARRSAGNFSAQELCEAVSFCHARGVRVYTALNTTVYPGELPALAQAVRDVALAGADAVIVQDLAVASLVRRLAPGLALHGSTQMSVQSVDGAKQLAALGFSRVILARELTLGEIERITAECGIETEVFVHGALCMSVSGQCYMSAFLGGRSGNRGGCAGPCRLPFDAAPDAHTAAAHHLSLKDLCALPSLPRLTASGVASVKIEGRLRPPEYVAAAVDACLHARAGEPYDAELLQNVFSRSGFTNGYLENRRGAEMFGTRTEADAAAAKRAAPLLRELYRRERPRVGVSLALTLTQRGACLAAADRDGHRAEAAEETPLQPGRTPPEQAEAAYRRALEKTGGTPFFAEAVTVAGAQWFLPGGTVTALRRQVLEELLAQRQRPHPLPCAALPPGAPEDWPDVLPKRNVCAEDAPCVPSKGGDAAWNFDGMGLAARFASVVQIPQPLPAAVQHILVPLAEWRAVPLPLRAKTWLELPRALFCGAEDSAAREVQASRAAGFAGYVAENIAHFHTCAGLPILGGFGLNVTNPLAARTYAALGARALTLSPELTLPDFAQNAAVLPALALAYGHMPLMLTRSCPLRNVRDCAHCDRQGMLLDRKGMRFPVRCSGPEGARTVYNPIPLYWGDRRAALSAVLPLLYFTLETPHRVGEVLTLFAAGQPFDGPFTRGLYEKGTA